MKGIVVDLQEADIAVLALPDGKYVAFYPAPMCKHRHDSPDDAMKCMHDAQKFMARSVLGQDEALDPMEQPEQHEEVEPEKPDHGYL